MNEWSSEVMWSSNLYRGSFFEKNGGRLFSFSERFSCSGDEKKDNLGFRIIIYK